MNGLNGLCSKILRKQARQSRDFFSAFFDDMLLFAMTDHDHSYKLLFSHPEMVRDLLRSFVLEDWVSQIDFSTLERMSDSYISDTLRERHDDLVWRVQFRDEWLYVYLLLEFQSTQDRFMAARIMEYIAMLYRDIIRRDRPSKSGKLPPVLPIVLYNGDARWNAACDISDLIEEVPGGLAKYRPRLRYLLIDEGAYPEDTLRPLKNVVSSLFQLESSTSPENIRALVKDVFHWLKEPEQAQLRRAFTVYLARVYFNDRPELLEMFASAKREEEVDAMLATRLEEWKKGIYNRGIEEGFEKGIEKERLTIAKQMLEEGINEAIIAKTCGLSSEQIEELKKSV
jgi:predicted transposase/invertase (TIGR01784 family)